VAARGKGPAKVGHYEIVLQIARGGMATVSLARAEGLGGSDRYVALKLTAEHLQDDPDFAHHLIEEASLVANLRHPNVVPVLDVGEDRKAVYLVMEYVPGDTLAGLMKLAGKAGAPLPPRIGLRILLDALNGLHAAHEHSDENGKPHRLVHRDFSPQNILVGTDGVARLTDFGIAKAVSRVSITIAGTLKGKISYSSPEQVRGDEDLDRRCDIWAAGIIAWELLAGKKAYSTAERSLLDIVKGPPPRLGTVVSGIAPALEEAVAYALQMAPSDRPATAKAFARILGDAAKKANVLAELDEVAAHVQRAAAPVLQERKRKITESQPRETAPPSSPWNDQTVVMTKGSSQPSLPDLPDATIAMSQAPVLPPDRQSAPPRSQTPRMRPPELTGASSSSIATFSRTDPTRLAAEAPPSSHAAQPSTAKRTIMWAAGTAAALLLVFGVVVVATTSPRSTAATAAASSTARLELVANAPIARVRIGERTVDVTPPATSALVDLTEGERASTTKHPLPIVATSADGRAVRAAYSGGDRAVTLTFGPDRPR
jgi:serine/threonine protein kinase